MKTRDYQFDNIKGILVFLVIVIHTISSLYTGWSNEGWKNVFITNYLYCLINFFVMPVFIFISGFFSKRHSDYETYVKKNIRNCLIPYLIFNVLYGFPSISDALNILKPNWIMWYLLSLFSWRIVTEVLIKFKYPLFITIFFALYIGIIKDAGEYLSISKTICFFPYFMGGYLISQEQIDKIKNVKLGFSLFALFLLCVITYFYTELDLKTATLFLNSSYSELGQSYMLGTAIRVAMLIVGILGILFFFSFTPAKQSFFSNFGMYSITIYLGHGLFIRALKFIKLYVTSINIANPFVFIIFALLFSLILCFALGNKRISQLYNRIFDKISSIAMQ